MIWKIVFFFLAYNFISFCCYCVYLSICNLKFEDKKKLKSSSGLQSLPSSWEVVIQMSYVNPPLFT